MLRRVFPVCLVLALWGCGDSKSAVRGAAGDADENRKAVEAALEKLNTSEPKDVRGAAAGLEQALAKDPENVEGLTSLAQAVQYLARHPAKKESVEPVFHKSADLVRRVLKIKPSLPEEDQDFRRFASAAIFNDACAFAREKKTPEAMTALREAVDLGFSQIDLLESSDELASVREDPEFAPFVKEAREKISVAAKKEVQHLLAENKSFDFDFDVEDINGNKVSKAGLAGKVLIVDIWGTWCPPCKMEIPHFVALDKQFSAKGLQVVGLNSEGDSEGETAVKEVKRFCKKEGVTYPCALITEDFIERIPDFEGFPTTLFLDRKGKVRLKVTGYHDMPFLQAAVESLLNEKSDGPGAESEEKDGG